MQDLARYSRQILFQPIGQAAQRRLLDSRVTLIGCGALGTVLANTLVRGGLGFLRIVDRDYVELNNLQRQVLFNEQHVAAGTPKAVVAAEELAKVNSTVRVEPLVLDATGDNIESLIEGADLILDGTDNFEIRYVINDAAVKHNKPWVYGACIGATGMVMPILPGVTPCLRCIWDSPPPPGSSPTCDTAGVLASIVNIVASLQAVEALKILTGQLDAVHRKLLQIDAWSGQFLDLDMSRALEAGDCPCCKHGHYEFLAARQTGRTLSLCGRDAVQVSATPGTNLDLSEVAARLAAVTKSPPTFNRYLLRFEVDGCRVTLFPDGRAIIAGVSEPEQARSIYAKYIGT